MPEPTPIFRITLLENLAVYLSRGGLHAPNCVPKDGLHYEALHVLDLHDARRQKRVPCPPGGTIHDYVPFYFGPRSPMLFMLHTGRVKGFNRKQTPIICLVSSVQDIIRAGLAFVFTDGHALAGYTSWFKKPSDLDQVDWEVVYADQWNDSPDDPNRQCRKQAEFLIHGFCPWDLIHEIGVCNGQMADEVWGILGRFPADMRRPVCVRDKWYY